MALLLFGAGLGFVLGGAFGLALAGVCLVAGLVLLVARQALGTKRPSAVLNPSSHSSSDIIVLLKEVHARPLRNGKFQEIHDPHQTGLQFEIFVHCWLVNSTDDRLGVAGLVCKLSKPGGEPLGLERITGDLEKWKVGRLRDEIDSWGVRYLQAAQETMEELRTEEPLEAGSTRQGWLHLRAPHLTPAEMKNAGLALEVVDARLRSHFGELKGPHRLPGRVWPFRPELAPINALPLAVSQEAATPTLGTDRLNRLDTVN